MSIDYKMIYDSLVNLHKELILDLGKSFLYGTSTNEIFKNHILAQEGILFPNSIFSKPITIYEHHNLDSPPLWDFGEVKNEEIV